MDVNTACILSSLCLSFIYSKSLGVVHDIATSKAHPKPSPRLSELIPTVTSKSAPQRNHTITSFPNRLISFDLLSHKT